MPKHHIPSTDDSVILARWEAVVEQENLNPNTGYYWSRRKKFLSAELRKEFSQAFGVDVESLEGWKRLCIAVRGNGFRVKDLTSIEKYKGVSKCQLFHACKY